MTIVLLAILAYLAVLTLVLVVLCVGPNHKQALPTPPQNDREAVAA